VVGGVLAHGAGVGDHVWTVAALFGMTSVLVLYHHHFLHWEADRLAGKGSPVALLGPARGAAVGVLVVLATSALVAWSVAQDVLPTWGLAAALTPMVLLPAQWRVTRGAVEAPDRVKVATAAFFAMLLTDLALVVSLWTA